uniref:Reverse transcriptase domain-containing protein n=1 Tax=Tanacetum cinerariifolium TaxID=118510 RepID=A0A699H6F7_TANCI|nr:reverse transcriptase domain-containing protein [Tanacetum cinerariifolium]
MSRSPERNPNVFSMIRHDRSESPRHRPKERRGEGVFNRLGSKGNSVSEHSESRYQSYHSRRTKHAPKKRYHEGTSSRSTKAFSESEDGRWDIRSQSRIRQNQALKKMNYPNHGYVKRQIPSHILQRWNVGQCQRGATCLILHSPDLRGHGKGSSEYMRISEFMHGITNPELVKRLHDNISKSVNEMMRVTITFLSGEVAASNQAQKKALPWRSHMANGTNIAASKGRGYKTLNLHMDEFHGVPKGIRTVRSSQIIPLECIMVSGPGAHTSNVIQAAEEIIKEAIHPEQTITIGSSLTKEGRKALCDLLRRNLDIFAWKPADMTGVLRHIVEHKLNVHKGFSPIRQKKRGHAPKRNKAIQKEVKKLVDADIMKEVYYHNWLSNIVMVKKHDDSWRICVDFKDLNKACPKDGYPLPEIDWKVESLCGYLFKCFLDAYKGCHQIKMTKEDEEETSFITSKGILCYSKMPFGLKNARATYQRLVDKAFQKQIGRNWRGRCVLGLQEVILCILCDEYYDVTPPDTYFRPGLIWGCDRLVMAAPVVSISLEVSVESIGSSFLRVILICSIPVEVSVAPEADPSESSPLPVSVAPMVSPFLCSHDLESDIEILERHVSPIPYDVMLTRWRSRVASRSSSPTTSTLDIPTALILPASSVVVAPSSEFPLAPVVASPGIRRRRAILIRHREDISIGHSSSDHSSSGHSISGHSLVGHASPDTIVADSSTPSRFVHPSLAKTLRCSEAYLRWRSPTAIVTSYIYATRALVLSCVDLLPHRKRFRDSISPMDSVEVDIDTDVLEDIKVDVMVNVEDEVEDEVKSSDRGTIKDGVDVAVGIDIPDGMLMPNAVEHLEQNMTIIRSGMTLKAIEELVNRRVEEVLATYEATRAANALEAENQSHDGSDGDNRNGENGNGRDGNGGNGNSGNGNPNEDNRGARPIA